MAAKVQVMPYAPPQGFIDYWYSGSTGKPDRYPCDVYWDGPDQFVETTYGKGGDRAKHWVKLGECERGDVFRVRQVYSPKEGQHEPAAVERMSARYYVAGTVGILWGEGTTLPAAVPMTPEDARGEQYVWCLRVPLRPTS